MAGSPPRRPSGRALLNKEVGDEVKVVTPGGTKSLEIRKLTTIHDEGEDDMTATRAIDGSLVPLSNAIVRWLALSKIHPNVLTFLGLLINIWAAWLFAAGSFQWGGVVVTGAAIFDMVDGRVARATSQVTRFGGFFDSVLDRYSDLALYIGLLVYYASINRFFYIVLTAIVMDGVGDGQLYAGLARRTPFPSAKWVSWSVRAHRADHHRRPVRSHGRGVVGDRGAVQRHRGPPHDLHLPAGQTAGGRAIALAIRQQQSEPHP